MNEKTDSELLRAYSKDRSEAAFAELVRRHVDFVHSAAQRMVCDSQLAQDVSQAVFLALAKEAATLVRHPVLSGWLHRTTRNIAAQTVRTEVRRHAREREAASMNQLLPAESEISWQQIAPHLDEALADLNEPDRDVLLLRYFERKSAREIAQALGVSDEAAQKRVNRAVDRLRDFCAKRGVAVGASGLVVLITANAVQAAPAGLALSITTAAALAGAAAQSSTVLAATKAIAMTTFQKTIVGATLAVAVGAGVFEARQNTNLRGEIASLKEQQPAAQAQIEQLQRERDDAANRAAALANRLATLSNDSSELLRLRAEVGQLRSAGRTQTQPSVAGLDPNDPSVQRFLEARAAAQRMAGYLEQMPEKKIPELKLLTDEDWLAAAKSAKFDTDADVRQALSDLRSKAKQRMFMGYALNAFAQANDGRLPTDVSQLKPWFKSGVMNHGGTVDDETLDAIFQRYKLLRTGNVKDYAADAWFVAEKAPVDKDYDSRAKFGLGRSTVIGTGLHSSGDPDDPSY